VCVYVGGGGGFGTRDAKKIETYAYGPERGVLVRVYAKLKKKLLKKHGKTRQDKKLTWRRTCSSSRRIFFLKVWRFTALFWAVVSLWSESFRWVSSSTVVAATANTVSCAQIPIKYCTYRIAKKMQRFSGELNKYQTPFHYKHRILNKSHNLPILERIVQ